MTTEQLAAAVRQVLPSARADLERLVRIPSVSAGAIAAPFTARTGGRAYQAARSALEQAWGRPAVDAGAGGSIPFVTAYAGLFPDAEILITGVEDPGTRAHSTNESLHLATFERACLAEALLLRNLAGQDHLSRTALLRALGSRCGDTSQRSCSRPPSRSSWRASWGSASTWPPSPAHRKSA